MAASRLAALFLPMWFALFSSRGVEGQVFPLDEYDTHVRNYLASLENLAFDIAVTNQTLDGEMRFEDDSSVVTMPGHFRVKTTTRIRDKDSVETRTEWELLRPDGFFLIRETPEGKHLLKEIDLSITSPLSLDPTPGIGVLLNPITNTQYPLIRLLRGGMRKTHVVNPTSFSKRAATSDTPYTLRVSNSINGNRSDAEIRLNERWLIKSSKLTSDNLELTRDIAYTEFGERLLPSRITIKRAGASGPGFVAEFRNYKAYQGSLPDFSLTQFGLPEPRGASSMYQAGSRWYLWLTGLALAALGIGAVLRWHAKKRAA